MESRAECGEDPAVCGQHARRSVTILDPICLKVVPEKSEGLYSTIFCDVFAILPAGMVKMLLNSLKKLFKKNQHIHVYFMHV